MTIDMRTQITDGLRLFCQRHFQHDPQDVSRITAGANMEIWAFDSAGQELILRRHPGGIAPKEDEAGLSLNDEASIVELAHAHDVLAPRVIGRLQPEDGLGVGFVMQRAHGEALPYKLFKDPNLAPALQHFSQDCATQLAKIHTIAPEQVEIDLPALSSAQSLASLKTALDAFGVAIPAYWLALNWLEKNIPETAPPTLLHGDFRMGNLLVDETGIAAVLDWELAHFGDPAEDLAWLCMPSWRFGVYEKPVGGVGQIEDLLAAYHRASGQKIDRKRFDFWLVYATLRWGMMTLKMTDIWRKGLDRSMERALIGTRASEVELDLLFMLEDDAGMPDKLEAEFSLPETDIPSAEPQIGELIAAMTGWIRDDLMTRETGAHLFNARVGVNNLSIIQRMNDYGPEFHNRAEQRLAALGQSPEQLCADLYGGQMSLQTPGLLTHLRLLALERLSMHQPRYVGLKVAKQKWQIRDA
jgi:aminoglycoside phosphotransferase (APT) family kinase protein